MFLLQCNVYIWKIIRHLDVLIQFFNHLPLKNLMHRIASISQSSNQFWCSSYMTRCTLSYQPLHLLPFRGSCLLPRLSFGFWGITHLSDSSSITSCLLVWDTLWFHWLGNSSQKKSPSCLPEGQSSASFNDAKNKKSPSEGENETKSVISRIFEGVQCALAGGCAPCSVQLQESVQCALEGECAPVCSVHLKESVRQCAVCTCRKVHRVWNILAHDTGRHEIDREISAIIVLEAL